MVIPLLPAVFLVNPMIWRNVCPLATINTMTGQRMKGEPVAARYLPGLWSLGLLLLLIMVPARRFLFNQNGPVLAGTIVAVAGLALATGWLASRRGGFCNTLCPVLPVEKLYGQSPLVRVGSARCANCTLCTPSACIDLAGRKSARQSLSRNSGSGWLFSPLGIFAAAFPGFVFGYFNTVDGPLAGALPVYRQIGLCMATSYAVAAGLVVAARIQTAAALVLLGAAAVGLYYWFSAPALVQAYSVAEVPGAGLLRAAVLGLVGLWLTRALGRDPVT